MKTMKLGHLILAFIALVLMLAVAPAVIQAAPLEGAATGGVRSLHNLKIPFKARPAPVVGRTDDDPDCYTLMLAANPAAGGSVPTATTATNCGSGATAGYLYNTAVSLSATPAAGYHIVDWTGADGPGTGSATNTVTMKENESVTVNYEADCYTLTLAANPAAGGSVPTATTATNCGSGATAGYLYNTAVSLSATPAPGYHIVDWTGADGPGTGSATNTVTMKKNESVTVNYEADCYTLTLAANPAAGGSVPTATTATNCGSGATAGYLYNTAVSLSATPAPGYHIVDWTNADGPGTGSATNTVTMKENESVTVNYEADCYTLTLAANPAAGGSVPTATTATNCGSGATAGYLYNTAVSLSATPAPGYHIVDWTNADGPGTGSATNTVTMKENESVTVNYEADCYTLTLAANPAAGGSVPTATTATNCGSGATAGYLYNTAVNLSATPAPGYHIVDWTNADGPGTGSATNTVTMKENESVTVNYEAICYTLTLSRTGTGNVPTASPDRSTGCSKGKYHVGQKINLTAAPAWMWHVDSWNGTDNNSSTSNNNTATMPPNNHTVTVNYKATPPTCYTLLRSYTGEGKAPTASPTKSAGCPVGQYVAGELITLTAEPAAGWRVMEWMGTNNDSSTATTNTLFMLQRNSTVIVVYTPICYELTLGHLGQGGNPVASPGKSEKCSDPGQYIAGEPINLFASPAPGWYVESWLGTDDDESSTTQNSVAMPANNRVVTVIYAAVPPTCYTLALSFTGQGGPPTAEPANSPGCDTGQYTAGQVIALTAWPDDGWRVKAWSGTDDNSSVALTNSVTMPAADRTASVVYEIAPVVYSVFTPIVLR